MDLFHDNPMFPAIRQMMGAFAKMAGGDPSEPEAALARIGLATIVATTQADAKKQLDDLEASVSRYKMQHNGELPQQGAAEGVNRADSRRFQAAQVLGPALDGGVPVGRPQFGQGAPVLSWTR